MRGADQRSASRSVESPNRFGARADAVHHAQVKIAYGEIVETNVATGIERSTAAAGEDYREIDVRVPVAIGAAAAIDDLRIVQKRVAVDILSGFHLFQKVGQLLHVPDIDLGDFFDPVRPIAVVGEVMVAVADADFGKITVVAVAGDHKRGDARGVGLERQNEHVVHQPDILGIA